MENKAKVLPAMTDKDYVRSNHPKEPNMESIKMIIDAGPGVLFILVSFGVLLSTTLIKK